MVDEKKVKSGKKSKAQGGAFENRVRKDLEEKGWVVDKWSNNVEFQKHFFCGTEDIGEDTPVNDGYRDASVFSIHKVGKLIPAKPKFVFNPALKRRVMMGNSSGFPDFIAFRNEFVDRYAGARIIGVESKMNGDLDREEKEKCKWLLDNKIFSKIFIAEKTKVKNKIVIDYHDFKIKYKRFYENV